LTYLVNGVPSEALLSQVVSCRTGSKVDADQGHGFRRTLTAIPAERIRSVALVIGYVAHRQKYCWGNLVAYPAGLYSTFGSAEATIANRREEAWGIMWEIDQHPVCVARGRRSALAFAVSSLYPPLAAVPREAILKLSRIVPPDDWERRCVYVDAREQWEPWKLPITGWYSQSASGSAPLAWYEKPNWDVGALRLVHPNGSATCRLGSQLTSFSGRPDSRRYAALVPRPRRRRAPGPKWVPDERLAALACVCGRHRPRRTSLRGVNQRVSGNAETLSSGRIRTYNPPVNSRMLYPQSTTIPPGPSPRAD
jgi:hypothetical protein